MNYRLLLIIATLLLPIGAKAEINPIEELIERIAPGRSSDFIIKKIESTDIFFEIESIGDKIAISGNDYVSIATGLNYYLKHFAGQHVCRNNMTAELPKQLPPVIKSERHITDTGCRYYLNYCTHSYSMAFWGWDEWQQEIDRMALLGINMPLAITGTDALWHNILLRLGYSEEETGRFIAGPAFQAWWLMNNLEGHGGPNSLEWYKRQENLQKKILERMRQLDMEPVLPGYSGMVPHDAGTKLNLDVRDPGKWCSYNRPAFLQPTDSQFEEIAAIYYEELYRLYGKAKYYSMDPFHEGGNTSGIDLDAAGKAIMKSMKRANRESVWVVQGWQGNPRKKMIENLPHGDILVLDLFSESRPQWHTGLYCGHDWAYCMLLNFGDNVGLHGKMQHVIDSYHKVKFSPESSSLKGIGLTMEGIENNPVMYELMAELPWIHEKPQCDNWLRDYCRYRYGTCNNDISQAWRMLANSIYNCPPESVQQGTSESIFCSRPSPDVRQASSWSGMEPYYDPDSVIIAARLFHKAAKLVNGNNFNYDLVDITRQAIAEEGRKVYTTMKQALEKRDVETFTTFGNRFLNLILTQDSLLSAREEFTLQRRLNQARAAGSTDEEKSRFMHSAVVQVTTWGGREASEQGGLHDYAHKEWSGLLRNYYYHRWKLWIDTTVNDMKNNTSTPIDWYATEESLIKNLLSKLKS